MRCVLLLLGVATLAACSDSTGSDRLTTDDVAGFYQICTLGFTPEGGVLPPVNVVAAAFETSNTQVTKPRITADVGLATFELKYTPKGQFSDRELDGTYAISGRTVTLKFGSSGDVPPSALLLPGSIPLAFSSPPQQLSLDASSTYSVPRADYARLAGVSESGLAQQIPGRLSARFTTAGTCS